MKTKVTFDCPTDLLSKVKQRALSEERTVSAVIRRTLAAEFHVEVEDERTDPRTPELPKSR